MTVWIVIIISGLMTNIHDPLTVVVPCLSAGPCGLVSGLFQSVSAHHNQSQFHPRAKTEISTPWWWWCQFDIWGTEPSPWSWWWSSHPGWGLVCGLQITGPIMISTPAPLQRSGRAEHCLDTSPTVTWHHRVTLMEYYGSEWEIETLKDLRWSSPAFRLGVRIQFVWRQPGEEC